MSSRYHERWQHEITYLALRHTLLGGRVLRSGDPEGLKQEMWALLALYQALRIVIIDAIATVPGTVGPRRRVQPGVQPRSRMLATVVDGPMPLTGLPV